jgi:glyoxylase-like metal-dependent hydrolase (beta-lactamase superfamily II)
MAVAEEALLNYPWGEQLPEPGHLLALAPGVRWLRMSLPFALDHINLWLLRDRSEDGQDGWAIVDCGIANDSTRAAWAQVFAHGLEGLPVLRVLVTHMHPDHLGLGDWLCEHWHRPGRDCRLWMSATDWHAALLARHHPTGFGGEAAADFFAQHGLRDEAALQQVRGRADDYARLVPAVPTQFRRLMDGMVLRIGAHDWHCIAGHGHAPEHMALSCPSLGVLISGDMVLPRISTNVSVIASEPEADPLPLYLGSLARYLPLPADTLVLPSHGRPFTGLHERIRQLQQHHDERFAEVLAACAQAPCAAADLLPVLFKRRLDAHQTPFAMGEAIAHLHALWGRGQLLRRRAGDGVWRFHLAQTD